MTRNNFFVLLTITAAAGLTCLGVLACGSSSSSSSSSSGGTDAGAEAADLDATTAFDAPNLVENPSFEQSQTACAPPWQPLPGSTLTTANSGHAGSRSCQICNLDAQKKEVGVVVEVPIAPPTDGTAAFALSAFFRDLDGGTGAAGNGGRLTLLPKDANNQPLTGAQGQLDVPIQSTSWRTFSTACTPTKAATKHEARIGGLVSPNGCISVDDVVLYRAP